MGIYRDHILPFLTDRLLAGADYVDLRREACTGLQGRVLEIGFGSGLNLPFFGSTVREVFAIEPAPGAWQLAAKRLRACPIPVRRIGNDAQVIPLEEASVDAVLMTWVLCSLPDQAAALREIHRVLKPGGKLHFVEHGLAESPSLARWQHRLTPLQKIMAGGCRLDTDVTAMLDAAGFSTEGIQRIPYPGFRLAGAQYLGICGKSGKSA